MVNLDRICRIDTWMGNSPGELESPVNLAGTLFDLLLVRRGRGTI